MCSGIYGEYLKLNIPYRASLYLVSGLPIIIWSKAALADFVVKNNCGIVIDSLGEIKTIVNKMPEEEYRMMKKNAELVDDGLSNSFYFKTAIKKCEANNNYE